MVGVYRADRVALNFYDFCDFSSDPQKYVQANKNHHKHFSRKNLLQKKYSLTYKAPSTVCPINLKAELYFPDSAPSVHTSVFKFLRHSVDLALNSLHKNRVLSNRVCSITTYYYH